MKKLGWLIFYVAVAFYGVKQIHDFNEYFFDSTSVPHRARMVCSFMKNDPDRYDTCVKNAIEDSKFLEKLEQIDKE